MEVKDIKQETHSHTEQKKGSEMPPTKGNSNNEKCGTCGKIFAEEDNAIGCEGRCESSHHRKCAGITQGEFKILKRKNCKLS
jgi:hypothetical protein